MNNDKAKRISGVFSREKGSKISGQPVEQNEESEIITIILAVLGAVIGTLPSMLLWVVLKKVYSFEKAEIAGIFMMIGELYFCNLMTKKRYINVESALFICVVVMVAAVYLCEKVVWTWEIMYIPSQYEASFTGCFENFGQLLKELDMEYDFQESLIKSYALAAMGGISGGKWLFETNEKYGYFDN
ncbi:MAG: hypothetical protein J1E40_11260 [Oscillospiraceae bacterium]|nr:hypothetical protein [Oscillospiraceae bacterium]